MIEYEGYENEVSVYINVKEYERLKERDDLLSRLEAGGVEDWEWYDESVKTTTIITPIETLV